MPNNDHIRRSISATLTEIEIAHRELLLAVDPRERAEALEIIDRIEAAMRARANDGEAA